MARIRSELVIDADAEAVWNLVTDWPVQTRWIPLTAVTIDRDSPCDSGLGTRFTGRTQLGPIGFDDPMEVIQWQPPAAGLPGHCRIRKRGPWLTGSAEITVQPAAGASRVEWTEQVRLRWLPRLADPVIAAVGSAFFGRVLRKMAAELARTRAG